MERFYQPPTFPLNLNPAVNRSLSLQFILEELLRICHLLEQWPTLPPLGKRALIEKIETLSLARLHAYIDTLLSASSVCDSTDLRVAFEAMEGVIRIAKHALLRSDKKAETAVPEPFFSESSLFFASLFPFFEELKSDENILFYCLEQRKALNHFFGSLATEKLLQRLFPAGPESLREYLEERYSLRNFSHHLAKHQALLDEILWPIS